MADHLASLVNKTLNIRSARVQNLCKSTKVANLACSPKVWWYTADFFFQALKQVDSFWTRLVEVSISIVSMFVCRCLVVEAEIAREVKVYPVTLGSRYGSGSNVGEVRR